MNPQPPLPPIDYRSAEVAPDGPITVHQDGPDTVIVIGPTSAFRLLLVQPPRAANRSISWKTRFAVQWVCRRCTEDDS